ncbi:MAG TPA: hypothetical protein VIO35_08605, partial [Chloroflexota bacterium]
MLGRPRSDGIFFGEQTALIAETLTNRAIPASLWGMLLLAKVLALSRYVQSTTAASGSAVFWAGALQQALVVGFTALIAALFATRQSVVGRQGSALGRVVAIAGTFALAVPVAHDGGEPGLAALLISSLLVLLFVAFGGLQLARTHLEESALEASFPDYRAYRQR